MIEDIKTMTTAELFASVEPGDWGPWRLNPANLTLSLRHERGHERYYVDLERCLTSAQVLDWICQLAGKSYADQGVLGGLVHALDDVLDPQATLCSFGKPARITPDDVARRVRQAAERWPLLTCR